MRIKFEEKEHKYTGENGDAYTSVSSFAKHFEEYVDWKDKAKKKSAKLKKEGIIKSYQDLLAEWDMKREKGTEAGTIVHKIKEDQHLENTECKVHHANFDEGVKWSLPITELENNVDYPELMIYNHEYKICGQSDLVKTRNWFIQIQDYKTDKSIERKAFGSEWGKPKKLTGCVSHLDDCNFNKYALKMSTYMYMLWKANGGRFKPGKIELIWCPIERDEDGIPVLYDGVPKILKEEVIEVPYLKTEVINMLKEFNDSKNT